MQALELKSRHALHARQRPASDRNVRTDLLIAACIFGALFLVYLAVSRHEFVAYDANSMVAVDTNLTNHFTLKTVGAFDDYFGLSTPYSPYGIGISILVVPAYALSKAVGHEMLLLSLINPLLTAATGAFVFAVGHELRWKRYMSVLAAFTFGLLTMALQSTTELFSEPAVGLCIVVLVWAVLRWRRSWQPAALVIGVTSAAVIQFRADSLLTVWVGLIALPLFVNWSEIRKVRNLAAMLVPVLLSLAFLAWYNDLRFRNVLVFSYNGQGFHTPIGRGLEGMLWSPGKSLFIFNPIALLGLVGIVLFLLRDRPVGVLFLLLIVPRILFFSKWDAWDGGVSWGPRFLDPVVALFAIAAVEVLVATQENRIGRLLARLAFTVLVVVSLGVSYVSVRVPYEQWFDTLNTPALRAHYDGGNLVPEPNQPRAVSNAFDFTFPGSHLMGNVDLLEKGVAEMAPWNFRGHRSVEGWLLLLCGFILMAAAMALGLRADAAEPGQVGAPEEGSSVALPP